MNQIKRAFLHYHYSSWWFKGQVTVCAAILGCVIVNPTIIPIATLVLCIVCTVVHWELDQHRPMNLVLAHKYSSNYRKLLERSTVCGCFYCERIFKPTEIKEWVDGGETALCPCCGIDSVLPGKVVAKIDLHNMKRRWFTGGVTVRFNGGIEVERVKTKPEVDDWGKER